MRNVFIGLVEDLFELLVLVGFVGLIFVVAVSVGG